MDAKTNENAELLEKAMSLGYQVVPNEGKWGLGKFLLLDSTGQPKYNSDSEKDCWKQAMRYADIYSVLVENPPADLLSERVADLCHEQWSGWMKYMFSKAALNDDGSWTMPVEFVQRWQRQMNTPYSELSKPEQDSDRNEAQKFLKLIFGG